MAAGHKRRAASRGLRAASQRGASAFRPAANSPQPTAVVSEIIGRAVYGSAQTTIFKSRYAVTTVDATIPDYEFYDKLRRGKQPGYKLGALFAKRIERIFANWILGRGVTITLTESGDPEAENDPRNYTDGKLDEFINANHSLLMTVKEDTLGLGDQYIIVNADGTLSVPSPDTVAVERDELDYRSVIAVRVTTKLEKATVIDEYRADSRTVTIRRNVDGRIVESVERYANLIGRIQVIHIAHGMSGNETNGHSIHEDLLKLYDEYDDTIHKMLDGAKLLGNPLLAFTGLEDMAAVIDANKPISPETYVDMEGVEVARPLLNIDRNSVLLVGKGGDAKFVAPPVGFTEDTKTALKTLFLLLLDRTGIAEFIWGNEMSSARASSDTQMLQWAHDIEGMQKGDERWLLALCEIWLAFTALLDPQIEVDELSAEWPPVLDENQELRLKTLEFAAANNLLRPKTMLELTELPVEEAGEEVEQAQEEADARADTEQERMIATAKATAPPARVGEMNGDGYGTNGYNGVEAGAIVAGAIRQLAGGA